MPFIVFSPPSKRYCISTHPDFVTFDRYNLLKHSDLGVLALAKQLTKDGCRRRIK